MKRRDVLLLRLDRERCARVSCEQLFMRFVDAEAEGSVDRLFENLERDLAGASVLQLTDRSWLARADLQARVNGLMESFAARGGRVTLG